MAFAYARTFEVFGKVGRVDLIQAWNDSEWVGPLDGQPASTGRRGLADTRIRLSANIVGAPALAGKDYAACRAGTKDETIAGVGLAVDLPTGQYDSGKLINFGGRTSINGEPNDDRREDLL